MFAYLTEAIRACDQSIEDKTALAMACRTLGNVLQALGRFEEAMDWQARSATPQPDRAELLASLGKLYAQQNCWNEAIAAYQQALRLQPDHAASCWSLANIYARLKQPAEELKYRQQSLKLKTEWATSQNYLSLGNLFVAQDWLEAAVTTYRSALQAEPNLVTAQHNLAVALFRQGDLEASVAAYTRALELHPNHSESYFGLGQALEQQERWQESMTAYRRAIDLDPRFANAVYALAALLFKQRQWEEAIRAYQQAIELVPNFAWSYHHLGVALSQQGQHSAAIVALRQAINLNPSFPWTYYHLATALSHQQQWEELIGVALNVIHLTPDLIEIYPLLGRAVRQQLQQQGLNQFIQRFTQHHQNISPVKLKSTLAQFYQLIGDKLMQQQQFDGAILFYHLATLEATEKDNIPTIESKLNQAQVGKEQNIAAIESHRQRLAQAPHLPHFYTPLVNLLSKQGDWQEAIALNQQADALRGWTQAIEKQYEFTWDWFSHQIADWQKHLKPLFNQAGLNVLEIGSFEGRSTCWLLDHILTAPDSQITCINFSEQERFSLNIARSGAETKVIQHQGHPLDLLPTLPVCYYDLIHLDGGSLVEQMQHHVVLCWERLSPGGIFIIDDYQLQATSSTPDNLKSAIDQVLSTLKTNAEVIHKSYQIIIRKSVCPPILN